jgi:hypothetical protein
MAEKEVNKEKAQKGNMDMLLENSIALQKTLADLAVSLKELNKKVSSMLELFEAAGKTIKEKPGQKPAEFAEKIDLLLKQNKTIAKGLLLLERAFKEKEGGETGEIQPLPSL